MKTKSIQVTTPTRIDLAGGTLDIAPLASILQEKKNLWKQGVQTINATIDLKAKVDLEIEINEVKQNSREEWENFPKNLKVFFIDRVSNYESGWMEFSQLLETSYEKYKLQCGVVKALFKLLYAHGLTSVKIVTDAQAPKGSGLGGSSSLVVALLAAFDHLLGFKWKLNELCEIAQRIEAGILGNLAGNQDHIAAANGGVLCVNHDCMGSNIVRLETNGEDLISKIVLAHTNQSHFSAFNNWCILEKFLTAEKESMQTAEKIAHIAAKMLEPLRKNDFQEVGRLMTEEWNLRRVWAEGISTPKIDELFAASIQAGSLGAKVCGAGGGGVLIALCKDIQSKKRVGEALQNAGGLLIPANFSAAGIRINSYEAF
jgi:D-glycero-alpha-D-manno-heptose-7-phosphate kinase